MTTGDWLITALGAATALGGLTLLAWSLLADRLRTRRARRDGTLRRCPKCWYDMSATEGLTCPECGKAAKHERRLHSSRRRYRYAAASLLILTLAAATLAYPHGKNGEWKGWLPETALLLLMRFGPDPEWASYELSQRSWPPPPGSLYLDHPHRFADWQADLLTAGCARVLDRDRTDLGMSAAWALLSSYSPTPEVGVPSAIRSLEAGNKAQRPAAAYFLYSTSYALPSSELEETAALFDPNQRRELRETIERRVSEEHSRQQRVAEEVGLNPWDIGTVLASCTHEQLQTLYRRLGLPRPAPPLQSLNSGWQITWEATLLDDQEGVDAVMTVRSDQSDDCDYLFFVQRGSGWKLAGRVFPSPWAEDWDLSTTLAVDQTRWITVRTDEAYRPQGSGRAVELWLRVGGDRLRQAQSITTSGYERGYLDRRLVSTTPTIHKSGGRHVVTYTMGAAVDLEYGWRDRASLGEDAAEYSFPLDADPAAFNTPIGGGPWGTPSHDWFLDALEEDLVPHLLPGLCELATSDDEALQIALRGFMDMLADSAEVENVRIAMDEYIAQHEEGAALEQLRQRLDPPDTDPPG